MPTRRDAVVSADATSTPTRTWRFFDMMNPVDVFTNFEVGIKGIKELLRTVDGDVVVQIVAEDDVRHVTKRRKTVKTRKKVAYLGSRG